MEILFEKFYQKINRTKLEFIRFLVNKVDWNNQLIGIKGARGAGKTTMLLQHAKQNLPLDNNQTLYVSLDDLYFTDNSLVEFATAFVKQGGKYLLLDEVHRYANWSTELKNIYDDHPTLQVIFTESSLIHIHKAKGDLSRRAVVYELPGLSFREFLNLTLGLDIKPLAFNGLIKNHVAISNGILDEFRPIEQFQKYIRYGYYPYFLENQNLYHQKLFETIEISLSTDLPSVYEITYGSVEKMRQLLYILAESVPFTPNITKISERMGVTRSTLLHFLYYLEELRVIKKMYSTTKGISILQKPEKLYLHHPNYFHALSAENINSGSIRESFFLNQVGALFPVTYAKTGDFIANKLVFETGGQNKSRKQIIGAGEKGFIVADDLEIGYKNKIPLWMFGLLY
jgi:uncharacterized protein